MLRASPFSVLAVAAFATLVAGAAARAENIDPDAVGSRYAWGENVGWINAKPAGAGPRGVQVEDFQLTGWMWGENVGWISLNCRNTAVCGASEWSVKNDGHGVLSGHAWSENAGWIAFNPSSGPGVRIDPATGEFTGEAWSENLGWIRFKGYAGRQPYFVKTSWRCDPAPAAPTGSPFVSLSKQGAADFTISWSTPVGATGFDTIVGFLDALRASGGSFAASVAECVRDDTPDAAVTLPLSHQGISSQLYYLVRAVNCGGAATWDDLSASQAASRDAGVAASPSACP